MNKKKIIVVGAGPGGLTAAMLLANKGFEVDVFEKQPDVGGRNARFSLDGFTFDYGPTFLMMLFILEEMFQLSGRKLTDYLDLKQIDPLYRLQFGDGREFFPTHDQAYMREQIETLFPGNWPGYQRYMAYEKAKFAKITPCLQMPYLHWRDLLNKNLRRALPCLDAHKSLHAHLGRFFSDEDLKIAFTFQAKYLGMSPWECPATFSIISYIEHGGGIFHPIGGLNQISHAMARIIEEAGGRIHLATGVKELAMEYDRVVGVKLENGETVKADQTIINADFGYAMEHLVPAGKLKNWTPQKLERCGVSCSTYMLYLGVDKLYDIPHHNIIFASNYRQNVFEMTREMIISDEPSIYIQNAGKTDPTLAPAGQSTLYVLVPVPNQRSGISWATEKNKLREKVLDIMEKRGGCPDLRQHIVAEKIVTPADWEQQHAVYRGATFNLAHNIGQMLYFRPHNRFDEEFKNCYLVGGGTHPGSGLPTIYESGRISAQLILQRYGLNW